MEFKVGDKVWQSGRGNGVVVEIESSSTYAINVDFENDDESYTTDGRIYETHKERSLFHGHNLKVVGEIIPVERWLLKYSSGVISGRIFESLQEAKNYNIVDTDATYHKVTI